MKSKCCCAAVGLVVILAGCGKNDGKTAADKTPAAQAPAPPAAQAASATATAIEEAKAILAKVQAAVAANNFDEAKKHVSRDLLKPGREEETLNGLAMLGSMQFNTFEADGDVVVMSFKEGNASMSTVMVLEDGRWKLGKEDADEDPAGSQAAEPFPELKADVKPLKAERNQDDIRGCTMSAELTGKDGELLRLQMMKEEITSCKDATGKALGSKRRDDFAETAGINSASVAGTTQNIEFWAKEKPAAGAANVTLEGSLLVLHATLKKRCKDTLKLRRGTKGTFAGRPMRVKGNRQEKDFFTEKPVTVYELAYSSRREFTDKLFEGITFSDATGRKIEGKLEAGSHWRSATGGGGTVKLTLFERVPEVTMSYELWDASLKTIPVKLVFPLQP